MKPNGLFRRVVGRASKLSCNPKQQLFETNSAREKRAGIWLQEAIKFAGRGDLLPLRFVALRQGRGR